MNEEQKLKIDRMRFINNTFSSNLALLAILFNVFYFVSIYKSDVGSYYYNILIGGSIVFNLIFMLTVFLASEGVKSYNIFYAYVLIVVGVVQIIRIFIIPMRAHAATVQIMDQAVQVMKDGQFFRVVCYLLISSACCFAAGIVGVQKSRALSAYVASLDGKAV